MSDDIDTLSGVAQRLQQAIAGGGDEGLATHLLRRLDRLAAGQADGPGRVAEDLLEAPGRPSGALGAGPAEAHTGQFSVPRVSSRVLCAAGRDSGIPDRSVGDRP